MITARNYAAQAAKFIKTHDYSKMGYSEQECRTLDGLSDHIISATHFVIPDGGRILNSGGKSLIGTKLILPYETITIEYAEPKFNMKTLIFSVGYDDGYIAQCLLYKDGGWLPFPDSVIVKGCINESEELTFETYEVFETTETIASCRNKRNLSRIAWTVVELLEALSCRNVIVANHQDASPANAKRIKAGKLPIYETKMLVIDTKATETSNGGCGGYHASPRQHLRRGHIRRHPTAGNLWINSCVVGDPSKGVINKSYAVK